MGHVNFTEFRQNLAGYMDEVCDGHAPLTVTRQGGRSVVVMSAEDYAGLEETLYLLRSPRNAERLLKAAADMDAGKGVVRDLIE